MSPTAAAGETRGAPPKGAPSYRDLARALVEQAEWALRAELEALRLQAERDQLQRQLVEEQTRGYQVAEQLADALAEVRRLRGDECCGGGAG